MATSTQDLRAIAFRVSPATGCYAPITGSDALYEAISDRDRAVYECAKLRGQLAQTAGKLVDYRHAARVKTVALWVIGAVSVAQTAVMLVGR